MMDGAACWRTGRAKSLRRKHERLAGGVEPSALAPEIAAGPVRRRALVLPKPLELERFLTLGDSAAAIARQLGKAADALQAIGIGN